MRAASTQPVAANQLLLLERCNDHKKIPDLEGLSTVVPNTKKLRERTNGGWDFWKACAVVRRQS